MKIIIEFDSIWQNSFLYGQDDKPIDKNNKRVFKATSKNKEIDKKEISKNTVLGILSRLIGDQRKLYQARESEDYYFKDKEEFIDFQIKDKESWNENIFIVNKSEKRPPQGSYLGVVKEDEKLFFSDTAPILWSILYLSVNELFDFLLSSEMNKKRGDSNPDSLLKKVEELQKIDTFVLVKDEVITIREKIQNLKERYSKKEQEFNNIDSPAEKQEKSLISAKEKMQKDIAKLEDEIQKILNSEERKLFDTKLIKIIDMLSEKFSGEIYYNNGRIFPMSLYAISLYLQVERMIENNLNINYCLKKNGDIQIQGFSKRNFNGVRDFLNKLAGNHNKTTQTPYPLTKASGTLEIIIDIERQKAKELKTMIENAGVSSFYLGKKGLAYVTKIDTREVKKR
jgi:uncharacterized protein (UPF0335 family)